MTTTAYKQIVAEELNLPFESITSVVMGDTDRTPDGGISAGFLELGGASLRKAAAYTREALLDLTAIELGIEQAATDGARWRRLRGGKRASRTDSLSPTSSSNDGMGSYRRGTAGCRHNQVVRVERAAGKRQPA